MTPASERLTAHSITAWWTAPDVPVALLLISLCGYARGSLLSYPPLYNYVFTASSGSLRWTHLGAWPCALVRIDIKTGKVPRKKKIWISKDWKGARFQGGNHHRGSPDMRSSTLPRKGSTRSTKTVVMFSNNLPSLSYIPLFSPHRHTVSV